jgi:transcriptional regulator with XRE-family HTH domain
LTQDEAAESLGVSRVTLSRYETGVREIPGVVREQMTQLYGTAPVTREPEPSGLRADDVRGVRYAAEAMAETIHRLLREARLAEHELHPIAEHARELVKQSAATRTPKKAAR